MQDETFWAELQAIRGQITALEAGRMARMIRDIFARVVSVGTYAPMVRAQTYLIRIGLEDIANPGRLKAGPTIAAGDFKVDIDGAGFTNLATLPSASPAAGRAVLITLSTTETDGDVITLQCVDQTVPAEWADYMVSFNTWG